MIRIFLRFFSLQLKHLNSHHSLAFWYRADVFFENRTTGWNSVTSFLCKPIMDSQYFSTSVLLKWSKAFLIKNVKCLQLFSPFIAVSHPFLIQSLLFCSHPLLSSLTKAFNLVSRKQKHFSPQVILVMQYSCSQMMGWQEQGQLALASSGRAADSRS